MGEGVGDGVGVGLGDGVGDGAGLGDGVGAGVGVGDGLGVGVEPPAGGGGATLPELLIALPPPQAAIVNASMLADAALIPRIPTIIIPRWGCTPDSRRHPVKWRGAGPLETGCSKPALKLARAPLAGWPGHTRPPPGHKELCDRVWSCDRLSVRGFDAPVHGQNPRTASGYRPILNELRQP